MLTSLPPGTHSDRTGQVAWRSTNLCTKPCPSPLRRRHRGRDSNLWPNSRRLHPQSRSREGSKIGCDARRPRPRSPAAGRSESTEGGVPVSWAPPRRMPRPVGRAGDPCPLGPRCPLRTGTCRRAGARGIQYLGAVADTRQQPGPGGAGTQPPGQRWRAVCRGRRAGYGRRRRVHRSPVARTAVEASRQPQAAGSKGSRGDEATAVRLVVGLRWMRRRYCGLPPVTASTSPVM